jgi:hypothetical protein
MKNGSIKICNTTFHTETKYVAYCHIFPGDGCAQKCFFDVILNGCIPLVPISQSSKDEERGFSPRAPFEGRKLLAWI